MSPRFGPTSTAKVRNRAKIKATLLRGASTFGELGSKVGLSPPVLTEYLKVLEKEEEIDRQAKGRRIEYYVTEKGKGTDQVRKAYLPIALQMMQRQTGKSLVTGIRRLFEMAEEDTLLLDAFIQWIWDVTALIACENFLRWTKKYPGAEGTRLMKTELRKRIPVPFQMGSSPIPEPVSTTLTMFQTVLDAMRDVVRHGKD